MSLLGAVVRAVSPKTAINYFRRNLIGSGAFGRKQITEIKNKLKTLSQEDRERLRTADLEDLTPEEVDLVMFGFVGFKDFGMPNKTIVQMKGNEFTTFKNKLNKIVDDTMLGKDKASIPEEGPTQTTLFNEGGKASMLKPDYIDIDGDGNKTEPMKTAAKQRDMKASGGLLNDDREQYIVGGIARAASSAIKKLFKKKSSPKQEKLNELIEAYKETYKMEDQYPLGSAPNEETIINRQEEINSRINMLLEDMDDVFDSRIEEATGYSRRDWVDNKLANIEDGPKIKKAEGGDVDGQMAILMMPKEPEEEMLPDDEMEDEYLDFILDEALDNEEEDYLMEMLQGNDRLSEIFDKVIDIAQEFAGSGPVEGPGSGVSDSIPARLSDGEFVFTAKAVEEIGADNLMAMMKDAEMKADERQGLAEGGEPEEEETVEMEVEKPASRQDIRVVKTTVDNGGKSLMDEDEISKSIKSKMMLDNRTGRHVQS